VLLIGVLRWEDELQNVGSFINLKIELMIFRSLCFIESQKALTLLLCIFPRNNSIHRNSENSPKEYYLRDDR
jgi:hypothetical protein